MIQKQFAVSVLSLLVPYCELGQKIPALDFCLMLMRSMGSGIYSSKRISTRPCLFALVLEVILSQDSSYFLMTEYSHQLLRVRDAVRDHIQEIVMRESIRNVLTHLHLHRLPLVRFRRQHPGLIRLLQSPDQVQLQLMLAIRCMLRQYMLAFRYLLICFHQPCPGPIRWCLVVLSCKTLHPTGSILPYRPPLQS